MSRIPVDVVIHDNDIVVRCGGGMWNLGDIDNRWLWVLGAIAFPEEHELTINDSSNNRQKHQKNLSCKRTGDVVVNLIDAMAAYGMGNNWSDGEIIYALIDCGVTKEDFKRTEHWDFVKSFFEEPAEINYEALAKDIYNWCIEHELWDDNTIYFNGKAWSNLPTWGIDEGKKIDEDLYEYENRNPRYFFEYANPDTLSMSFEGGLNHVLNDYNDNCLPLIEEFRELFHKYGLYYELGHSWNLSAAKE